jgi:hypothetical protein
LDQALQKALQTLEGYVRLDRLAELYRVFIPEKQADAGFALWNVAVLAHWMETKGMGDRSYGRIDELSAAEEGVFPSGLD